MRIRRIQITLPARLKDSAQHEARAIAGAAAQALWDNGGQAAPVTLAGQGQRGALLAQRVALALPRAPKGGSGHGG